MAQTAEGSGIYMSVFSVYSVLSVDLIEYYIQILMHISGTDTIFRYMLKKVLSQTTLYTNLLTLSLQNWISV